jgi:hypothetical protein
MTSVNTPKFQQRFIFLIGLAMLYGCSQTPKTAHPTANQASHNTISITIPAELELYELDGKTFKTPQLVNGEYHVLVAPGAHTMAIQYVENWNSGNDGDSSSGRLVKWEPVGFNSIFISGESYYFTYNEPNSYEEALSLKSKAPITLNSATKPPIHGETLSSPQLLDALLSGRFRFGAPSTTPPENSQPTGSPLSQLKFWWKQADQNEQQKFFTWITSKNTPTNSE